MSLFSCPVGLIRGPIPATWGWPVLGQCSRWAWPEGLEIFSASSFEGWSVIIKLLLQNSITSSRYLSSESAPRSLDEGGPLGDLVFGDSHLVRLDDFDSTRSSTDTGEPPRLLPITFQGTFQNDLRVSGTQNLGITLPDCPLNVA